MACVANAAIAAKLLESANAHVELTAEIALDPIVALDLLAEANRLRLGKIADSSVRADTCVGQYLAAAGQANAEDRK